MGLNEKEQVSYEKFWFMWRETEAIIWDWLEHFHPGLLAKNAIDRKNSSFITALKLIKSGGLLESNLRQALYDLSQLRNLFAHNAPEKIFGVPTEDAIPLLEQVHQIVSQKNLALEHLGSSYPVVALEINQSIRDLLDAVQKYDYSQFPVVKSGTIVGLVTSNTLARWLASGASAFTGEILAAPISELLPFVESFEKFEILNRNISLLDYWAVSNPSEEEIAPRVMILTTNGQPNGQIVRVATELDRLAVYRAVNPGQYMLG